MSVSSAYPDSLLFPAIANSCGPGSNKENPEICIRQYRGNAQRPGWTSDLLRISSASTLAILQAMGLGSGSRILLIADNSPAWLAIVEACWQGDFTLIPLIPDLALGQAQAVVAELQPDLLILGQSHILRWQHLFVECAIPGLVLADTDSADLQPRQVVGNRAYPAHVDRLATTALLCPDGLPAFMVFHSSGSTGAPKAIVYSKATMHTFLVHLNRLFDCFPEPVIHSQQPVLAARINVLPLSHFGGFCYCIQALQNKHPLFLLTHYQTEDLASLIAFSGTYLVQLVPVQLKKLLACANTLQGHVLKYCLLMGENPGMVLMEAARQQLQVKIFSAYGMSECLSGLIHKQAAENTIPDGSCGVHGFGEIKLVDSSGNTHPSIGEIWVRNVTTTPCYLDPALIERKYTDGWYRTGDCLSCDSDGYYYFQGRIDELLVIRGRNLYPHEVEELITSYPGVEACLAVVFSAGGNMLLGVIVVPGKGRVLSVLELMDFYMARGALYATPGWIMFSNSLPYLGSGKLNRVKAAILLEENYAAQLQQKVLQ